jgi:hypothetical protein
MVLDTEKLKMPLLWVRNGVFTKFDAPNLLAR